MKNFFLHICLLLGCLLGSAHGAAVFAQALTTAAYAPGEIIVKIAARQSPEAWLQQYNALRQNAPLRFKKVVVPRENICVFTFDTTRQTDEAALAAVQQAQGTIFAHFNYAVQWRNTEPNDPLFTEQWDMEKICMPTVWDQLKGGVSATGDTIVVAIVDSGVFIDHDDLKENIWYNKGEIPDDGLDNDNNGYIDDYKGLNVKLGNDKHSIISHGTQVSSIVGAKGNNNKGVTGVNWHVKLMLVTGILYLDDIREAFDYIVEQRRRYNQSNGAEGAFVVATNASFGISDIFGNNAPIWCGVYDTLGQLGVLSVGATENRNVNVDEVGDLPSTCSSPYLITVTNTTRDDRRYATAGYGKMYVDLGAPGAESYTLTYGGIQSPHEYGSFGGTSAASPHVAGAVGILFSMPSAAFAQGAKSQPAETVMTVKNAILAGVDPITDLQDKTVTGGRLNVCKAFDILREQYGGSSVGTLSITAINPTQVRTTAVVQYETPDFDAYQLKVFSTDGRLVYYTDVQPELFAPKQLTLSVEGWAKGMYIVSINKVGSKKVASQKMEVY